MFDAAVSWADYVKGQSYTVIDLGNPFSNPASSIFYDGEKVRIVGTPSK
jgi:hypothetical protein